MFLQHTQQARTGPIRLENGAQVILCPSSHEGESKGFPGRTRYFARAHELANLLEHALRPQQSYGPGSLADDQAFSFQSASRLSTVTGASTERSSPRIS